MTLDELESALLTTEGSAEDLTELWVSTQVTRIFDSFSRAAPAGTARLMRDILGEALRHGGAIGPRPVPMRLPCPGCGELHVDAGEFASKPHHTHACQHCGMVWRPAVAHTVGVRFLPGFRDEIAGDAEVARVP